MATTMENSTQTLRFILPSGYYVVIREMNGEDDDTLTNRFDTQNLEHHTNFLSSVIVDTDLPMNKNGKITREDALDILLNDKYCILFYCRIFSIDSVIKFPYTWELQGGKNVTVEYEDDLNDYVWDFKTPAPEEGEEGYNKYRVKPYALGAYNKVEHTLSSGKKIRFGLLNTKSERTLALALIDKTYSRTKDIISRGLEIEIDNKYMVVENFTMFTKREMSELYNISEILDPTFFGISELKYEPTGAIQNINLILLTDFFFPEEI